LRNLPGICQNLGLAKSGSKIEVRREKEEREREGGTPGE